MWRDILRFARRERRCVICGASAREPGRRLVIGRSKRHVCTNCVASALQSSREGEELDTEGMGACTLCGRPAAFTSSAPPEVQLCMRCRAQAAEIAADSLD